MSAPNDDQALLCHATILCLGREGNGTKISFFFFFLQTFKYVLKYLFHQANSPFCFKERSAVLSSMPHFSPSPESSVSIAMLLATREDESRIRPVKAGPSTAVHKVPFSKVLLLIVTVIHFFSPALSALKI